MANPFNPFTDDFSGFNNDDARESNGLQRNSRPITARTANIKRTNGTTTENTKRQIDDIPSSHHQRQQQSQPAQSQSRQQATAIRSHPKIEQTTEQEHTSSQTQQTPSVPNSTPNNSINDANNHRPASSNVNNHNSDVSATTVVDASSAATPSLSSATAQPPASAFISPDPIINTKNTTPNANNVDMSDDVAPAGVSAKENENTRIATLNGRNVEILINQKRENDTKTSKVTSILQQKQQLVSAEFKKLQFIKQELNKLDFALSQSIDTLRTEIEQVDRELNHAQQDYEQKQKLYFDAREQYAIKRQKKLLLTGHLDYIILTNEKNKSVKLKEMEQQLGIYENEQPEQQQQQQTQQQQQQQQQQNFTGFDDEKSKT